MSSLTERTVRDSGQVLQLQADARAEIEAHALQGYPFEIVGILAGVAPADGKPGRVTRIQRLVNQNTDRAADRYQVDGLKLMKAEQALEAEGLQILGYYHSHPDHPAMYSDTDRDLAMPNMAYLIVSVRGAAGAPPAIAEHRCWRLTEDRAEMLEDQLLLAAG